MEDKQYAAIVNYLEAGVYPEGLAKGKPEPIMLLILPIIPSRNSHNFYPLFLFYSHDITYYSCYIL